MLYNAGIDATFIGLMDGKYNVEHTDDPLTGHFKVYFGKNSLWEGTFEGDFVNGTCKEWEERIDVSRAKNGKYVAKSARLFLSAIVCFTRKDDAIRKCNAPLEKIYDKDLTTETVSNAEIQELTDSLQAQKSLLQYSLSKLNQLEEFDEKIPLKGILYEQMNQMLDRIENDMSKLVAILALPPSKKKPREIYYYNKVFDNDSDKLVTKYSKANRKFENKYLIFND